MTDYANKCNIELNEKKPLTAIDQRLVIRPPAYSRYHLLHFATLVCFGRK